MKKHVLLAMAVIMLLGTFKAMAQSAQELMDMNQQSKVEAVVRNQQMGRIDEAAHGNGQIQASQITAIIDVQKEVDEVFNALARSGITGAFQRSGIGQISDIAEKNVITAQDAFDGDKINEIYKSSLELQEDLKQIRKDFGLKAK